MGMGVLIVGESLLKVLAESGVDMDDRGYYAMTGPLVSYMGAGDEFVIDERVLVSVDGEAVGLADLIRQSDGVDGVVEVGVF